LGLVLVTAEDPQAYNRLARHFDVRTLPRLLRQYLSAGPLALADIGCGDGPFFSILQRFGYVSALRPVYAVDLQEERLRRVAARFPFVTTVVAPAHSVPSIPDGALDFVISTMVMEHVPDEESYLDEMRRVLKPGGRIYLTTVFKRSWAWYPRRREGRPVLDVSHRREYTDLDAFRELLIRGCRFASLEALGIDSLWFPLVDPILFLAARRGLTSASARAIHLARLVKVPVPGYYTLSAVLRA
jgi:SAM-dependent methyltransferase